MALPVVDPAPGTLPLTHMSDSPTVDSSLSSRGGGSGSTESCDSVAQCQQPPLYGTSGSVPWAGDPRADDKDDLCRLICENPDGIPLRYLASLLSDGDWGEYSARNFKFVSRFVKNSEAFRTLGKSGEIDYEGRILANYGKELWVEPRAKAFTCYRRKQRVANPRKLQEGDGAASAFGVNASETPSKFAKDRAKSYLNRHTQIGSDSVRRTLALELATELRSIEGRVAVLERTNDRQDLPEHLLIPYTTRFNDPGRAAESRERFDAAWSTASDRHSSAVMATLTLDPSLHASAIDAADALTETVRNVSQWLARDVSAEWAADRVGRKLPYLSAVEWTDSGLIHAHVVFFGASRLCWQGALSSHLEDKTGWVTRLDGLVSRGPGARWTWRSPADRPSDASAATQPREYLSEALRQQNRIANMDAEEFTDHVDSGEAIDSGLWKQALYWATGKQLWTCSRDLSAAIDARVGSRSDRRLIDRDLPHVSQYRFVGTSYYADLPGYVKRNAVLLGRPPPD